MEVLARTAEGRWPRINRGWDAGATALIGAAVAAWLAAALGPTSVIRMIGAVPLIFWLPGAALVLGARSGEERMSARDLAVSSGLSVALAIAAGLAFALATGGEPRVELATALAVVTVVAGARRALAVSGRIGPAAAQGPRGGSKWSVRWLVALAATCCLLLGLLSFFTWRLYVTPASGANDTSLSVSQQRGRIFVTVVNRAPAVVSFDLKVAEGGRQVRNVKFALKPRAAYRLELSKPKRMRMTTGRAELFVEPGGKLFRRASFRL